VSLDDRRDAEPATYFHSASRPRAAMTTSKSKPRPKPQPKAESKAQSASATRPPQPEHKSFFKRELFRIVIK